jgi:hypothetical protein
MLRNVMLGLTAGAAGTVALNVVTYLDMAVRGRPSSGVPAQIVDTAAKKAEINLTSDDEDDDVLQARESGLGALLGFVNGLGLGALYGMLRPLMTGVPQPLAGVGLGVAAMAGSDVPATALGVTNPKEWTRDSWISDIVPHLAYGMVVALVFDAFKDRR